MPLFSKQKESADQRFFENGISVEKLRKRQKNSSNRMKLPLMLFLICSHPFAVMTFSIRATCWRLNSWKQKLTRMKGNASFISEVRIMLLGNLKCSLVSHHRKSIGISASKPSRKDKIKFVGRQGWNVFKNRIMQLSTIQFFKISDTE